MKLGSELGKCIYDIKEEMSKTGAKNGKRSRKKVYQFSLDGKLIKEFSSLKEAGSELGIHYTNISSCCHGRIKTTGGYKWSFELP